MALLRNLASRQLSACGTLCINNALGLAASLGCPPLDGQVPVVCLCGNPDFAHAIRDCANQACGAADAASIIAYGVAYCSAAATASSTIASSTPTLSSSVTTPPATTSPGPTSLSSAATVSLSSSPTSSNPPLGTITIVSSPSNELSTGAKAGIGVGASIGGLLVILLAAIAFLLYRKRGKALAAREDGSGTRAELGPGLVPEMSGASRPSELEGSKYPEKGRGPYEM